MKLSQQDQESLLAILARIYDDILVIEQEFGFLIGEGDFRPRIDYFHDAIRAFSSGDVAATEPGGRLSVELLAYDLACLRYIESMPLSPFKPHSQVGSPSTEVMSLGDGQALTTRPKRADRNTRDRICELYKNYAVLFAALLKPVADRDYHDRVEDMQQEASDLKTLADEIGKLAKGEGNINMAANLANHLDSEDMRRLLMAFLQEKRYNNRADTARLMAALKGQATGRLGDIKAVEDAHMQYAMSQLAVYENSKDLLKKMASQGLNVVGKFVEASIAATKREMGR